MSERNHATENAAAWLESIREMIVTLGAAEEAGDSDAEEKAREAIQESPLSVEIRDGWRTPGGEGEAEEYRILLTTGGPALRIIGALGRYNEPDSARLEWQDWGTPWTEYETSYEDDKILAAFASQFYFGER